LDCSTRTSAARLYKAVDEKRARELAKKFLKEPWPAGPKELMPFFTGY
jgi:hypothetical protein